MKETTIKNYSWLDIIEPSVLEGNNFRWEYFLICAVIILLIIVLYKQSDFSTRLKFWLLSLKLKKDGDTRLYAKKMLQLLSLEKNKAYAIKSIQSSNGYSIDDYRLALLGVSYAKKTESVEKITNTLNKFSKWL